LFQKTDNQANERHLHPSIYKRIRKTKELINEGIDSEEFRSRGGLDLETFNALQQRWQDQKQRIDKVKQEILSTYGTLKNVPISVGPCKKIDSVIGTKNALVLLTEFKDKRSSTKPEFFKDLLFSKGYNRSMRDYYLEASWNQLDINGEVNDEWYTSTYNRSEYVDKFQVGGHYPKAQKLVEETILQAKNSGINFIPYAKDEKIEILILVYAGSGMDSKLNIQYIRPHHDHLKKPIEVQDGLWASEYCLIPELPSYDLGCFCHEVGHFLGLPDLYKEDYSPVVGSWCLMGMGHYINEGRTPSHPSAWCKVHLGWTEPELLNKEPQNYEIPALIDDKSIYRLDIEGSDGREYFLLENRQQKGFDKNLPANGLLIWHVNENACVLQPPNNDPKHFFLTLKQSDGKEDLQSDRTELFREKDEELPKDVSGDLGDPFPGITLNRTFDDESNPNSRSYQGFKSGVKVASISDSSDLMTAEIGTKLTPKEMNIQINRGQLPSQNTQIKLTHSPVKLTPLKFLTFLAPPKRKDPYQEGWDDYCEDLKEKIGIKEFQNGYCLGYRKGYEKAFKKVKKK
jgi:immune inhibitor A